MCGGDAARYAGAQIAGQGPRTLAATLNFEDAEMTYQGERARPIASEMGRYFEVSKVRIGADGHVSEVLWGEISASTGLNVGQPVRALAAEVVDAIHDGAQVSAHFAHTGRPERAFVVVEHEDGRECIAFADAPSAGRNLTDMERLDD
jgi:hypothetical protein